MNRCLPQTQLPCRPNALSGNCTDGGKTRCDEGQRLAATGFNVLTSLLNNRETRQRQRARERRSLPAKQWSPFVGARLSRRGKADVRRE